MQDASSNKTKWKRTGGLFVVTLVIAFAGCSSQSSNTNNTTATNTSPTPATATVTPSPTVTATPSEASLREAAMTWGHIEEARAQLDKAVEAENLREVHDATVKVRDSVNALPGKSAALPADKRESLNAQAKEVDRLAGKLGEAAHASNTDAVHENHKALNAALDQMKGLYPPGREMMDKGMEGMEMGKEMMDKGMVDKGMQMMDEGMDMMEMGKDMMDKDMMDKDMDMMMDKGMDMMDKGKATMNKGKDAMDKGMMEKGMHMMDNGMQMMGKSMDTMGKKMGDKSMPMKKKDDKKMKGMGHM